MTFSLFAYAAVLGLGFSVAADNPFETDHAFSPVNRIDHLLQEDWHKHGLKGANLCSDPVFLRRVYLDLTGALPTLDQCKAFLSDNSPDKRSQLINELLATNAFAEYQTMKWCDILRVKAEFPINLWPNAVQAYHRWIYESIRDNKPYDKFMRELLVSSGSNFRVPPVNFYRAVQSKTLEGISQAVALTCMGMRFETLSAEYAEGLKICFSRVAYKRTAEWKDEVVFLNPEPVEGRKARMPDGTMLELSADTDPRF